ncbi:flagellar biosynthesis anti-sigma factor FlgM [Lachnospiraceae bacterium LCP25S3_G4]
MKISIQNNKNNYFVNQLATQKRTDEHTIGNSSNRNFDAITIHSDAASIATKKFTDSVSSILMSELKKPSSPERLDTLQQQIQNGTYQVDANAIASQILLQGDGLNA